MTEYNKIIILGCGGHAGVVLSVLMELNCQVDGYLAPEPTSSPVWPESVPWLGNDAMLENIDPEQSKLVNGVGSIGSVELRGRLFQKTKKLGHSFTPLIHPSAVLCGSVELGEGVQIMAGVIVQTNVNLAENVLLNTGSIVDHDTQIGSNCHIAPGVCISGNVNIGDNVHIGTGASLRNGVQVGTGAVIGVGAVVISDVAAETCVVGNPARDLKNTGMPSS